jgi:hypothetical protein
VSTHAVGDEEQPLLFDQREEVFVVGALAPDVGASCVADAHSLRS